LFILSILYDNGMNRPGMNSPQTFRKIYKLTPIFGQFTCFLPNLRYFASPLFWQGCIMLYTYWAPLLQDVPAIQSKTFWLKRSKWKWTNHKRTFTKYI